MKLFYKEFCLGELDYINDEYVYNSLEGEKLALAKYSAMIEYNLENSHNLKSEKIFPFFKTKFLDQIFARKDILEKIGTKSVNDFDILEKFCKLNFDKFGYYLSN